MRAARASVGICRCMVFIVPINSCWNWSVRGSFPNETTTQKKFRICRNSSKCFKIPPSLEAFHPTTIHNPALYILAMVSSFTKYT